MKQFFKITLVGLFLLAFSGFAQTPQKIEQELVTSLKQVQKYSSYGSSFDDEKLSRANDAFEAKLLKYTKIPGTLSYKFPALSKLMANASSDDGKFRIYSWDTQTGGTMHEYSRIYQYQGADGKVYSKSEESSEEDGGIGSFVTDIFTVNSKEGKIYIVCSTFVGSTQDHSQSADLFKIKDSTLIDKVKQIKTAAGLTDTLNFEYNFFSVMDRKERPIKLILFDKKTNTLKIPVVINDDKFPNGHVTNKFINYRFDGTYFVKVI
jgi:hypothetical protein